MRKIDFPPDTPHLEIISKACPDILANGGSCIAGPDGEWVVEPVVDRETIIVAKLDYISVIRERQNFDPAGHYARPDVTKLTVNRQRQTTVTLVD
jgi:nitrilase